jgi:hypothetical protein
MTTRTDADLSVVGGHLSEAFYELPNGLTTPDFSSYRVPVLPVSS